MKNKNNTYNLIKEDNCVIIFGIIPYSQLKMIMNEFKKNVVMDIALSNMLGASYVFGLPKDMDRLMKRISYCECQVLKKTDKNECKIID